MVLDARKGWRCRVFADGEEITDSTVKIDRRRRMVWCFLRTAPGGGIATDDTGRPVLLAHRPAVLRVMDARRELWQARRRGRGR